MAGSPAPALTPRTIPSSRARGLSPGTCRRVRTARRGPGAASALRAAWPGAPPPAHRALRPARALPLDLRGRQLDGEHDHALAAESRNPGMVVGGNGCRLDAFRRSAVLRTARRLPIDTFGVSRIALGAPVPRAASAGVAPQPAQFGAAGDRRRGKHRGPRGPAGPFAATVGNAGGSGAGAGAQLLAVLHPWRGVTPARPAGDSAPAPGSSRLTRRSSS